MMTIREENFLAWFLVAVMILLYMTGCASLPQRDIEVQRFTIHIVPDMATAGHPGFRGWCQGREVWVKWQGSKPDFEMLGHEVWHLVECGGMWHGKFISP